MAGLKVLMVNYEFPPMGGGAGKAHLELLKQFSKEADLEIDVLTSSPYPGKSLEQMADNIRIYKVGVHKKELHYWRKIEIIEWLFKAGFEYRKLIRENEYDFAHAFFGFPTGWLCYRNRKKLPYMISFRGSDVPGGNARLKIDYKILGPLFKLIWKNASALYACSKGLKQRALNFAPNANVNVIPNGVELDRFTPTESIPDLKDLKLLTVGRLSESKRIELLIEAMQTIKNKFPNVTLTIAGSGGLYQKLDQLIKNKNMQNHVRMLGTVNAENIPKLYQQHHIFVTATAQEGMSNAMLEAMASGLPIVTTKCEGTDELIADNGIIVDPPQPLEIAKNIINLAIDNQRYWQMCSAARDKAEQFTWENVANKYIEAYQKICKGI